VFSILMPPGIAPKEEKDHLVWLQEDLGKDENSRFRVSDAEERALGPNEEDPRLRAVGLPCELE
jgi:hypothetical protein